MKTRLFVDPMMPPLYDAPAAGVGRGCGASCGSRTTSAARSCPLRRVSVEWAMHSSPAGG